MPAVSLKKLINSRASYRPINEHSKHLWRVMERKNQIMKVRLDIENGYLLGESMEIPDTQVLMDSFTGTHSRKNLWSIIKSYLQQLLP